MCFLSIINYSNILRIKIKSVYVKDFLISTKVGLKRGEDLHGEEPISPEPTFRIQLGWTKVPLVTYLVEKREYSDNKDGLKIFVHFVGMY